MSYKNSIKLLSTNFNTVWKQLLYMLITVLLCGLITWGVSTPVVSLLKEEGVSGEFLAIFEKIYTKPVEIITTISTAFLHTATVISSNLGQIWFSLFCTILSSCVLYTLLKNISRYNLSSLMYLKLTSFVEVGYTRNLISNFFTGLRFAFAKLVYTIPFLALKILILFAYFNLVKSTTEIFIGLFVVSLLLITVSTLETTLFVGMENKMLEHNGNYSAFKAFFTGNATILKQVLRVLSSSVIVVLTLILINVFLGIFTLGVALLITIPASMLFVSLFNITTYFGIKGERYYLTENMLATPTNLDSNKTNGQF